MVSLAYAEEGFDLFELADFFGGPLLVVGYLLGFLTSLRIVLQRREPTATLAWVLAVVLFPYLGVAVYILIGRKRLERQVRRRRARVGEIEPRLSSLVPLSQPPEAAAQAPVAAVSVPRPEDSVIARLTNRIGCRPPTHGNCAQLLPHANFAYRAMEEAIEDAKQHVHFQFYIIQPDATGRRFRDLLCEKVRKGVEVRVLTDAVGSFGIDEFMLPLVRCGGRHEEFAPVGRLTRRWHPNFRNHRKIVVVDGRTGFTGGCNIGDEYTGRKKRVGPWRDTHLRIDGPAASHLQEVFAEDWFFACDEEIDDDLWFPEIGPRGDSIVHIVASGPENDTQRIQRIFFAAINTAVERIYMTTPYFVPDQAMLAALQTAALRGVDVQLLVPARSDMPLVLLAGRSYYLDLLKTGVRIFEYQPGILHAKTMVVDHSWATVGSSNMDVRSFQLNFELNAAIYGSELANQLAELFERDLRSAREITLESVRKKRLGSRMAESLARVLSPVL